LARRQAAYKIHTVASSDKRDFFSFFSGLRVTLTLSARPCSGCFIRRNTARDLGGGLEARPGGRRQETIPASHGQAGLPHVTDGGGLGQVTMVTKICG